MDQVVFNLLGLLYWTAIIVFFVKGKIKWVTLMSLLTFCIYTYALGLICIYALPKNNIHGEVIPELLIAITLILIILSIFSIINPKNPAPIPHKHPSGIRWIYLLSALTIYFIGMVITLLYFYEPKGIGHTTPMPDYGVAANVIFSFISCVLLYLASREGTAKRPNSLRIVATLVILIFFSNITLVISLILMYSFPGKPLTSYPTLAGLNMTCYIVYALTLILMRREYVIFDSIKRRIYRKETKDVLKFDDLAKRQGLYFSSFRRKPESSLF